MTDQLLPSNITLLIVDDSESDRLTYSRYLQSDSERNYRIIEAATLEEGLELWRSQQPDIVLIELNLPDGNGLTFLEAINIDHADRVPVIMLTGQGNEKMAVNAMKLGASDYLLKGEVTPKLLTSSIRQVMRETALIQQLQRSQLSHQAELEERNKLLERISEKLQCTVEELKVSAEEKIEQHRLLQYEDDRKIAVESLHASEAKSRVILETIPDLMFRVGSDQVYREMVTSYRDIALFPRDYDLVGRSVADVLPPEAVQRKLHYLQQALQTGELQIYEQRFQIGDHLQYEEVTIIKSGEDEGLFMIRDISDRKRAEQALQQLNQSLEAKIRERTQELWQVNQIQRAIVCSTDYAIISTDLNGIIHTFNTGAEKMLGYSMEEIIGNATPALFFDAQELSDKITTASKILGKDIGVGIEALCNMAREGLIDEEWINIRKDGSRFPISISMSILKDDNDQVIGFLSVRKDISDRKQAEKALEESQRLLQAVLDCFPLAVFWKDRQSVLLGCNQIFATLSGLTSSREVVGKSNFDFSYSEEEAHKYTLDDREVMESGLSKIGIQETITLANGEIRWVETNKIPLRNLLGEVVGVVCTFQDISDRKFAEEALAESEAFNRQLIKEFPIGLASCRMDGQLVFVNSVFAKMLGRTIEETLELTYWDITPIKYAEQEAAQLERIQIEGRYGSYEKEYIHKDGHLVPVLLNGLVIAQKGELIIWSSVQDISDRKQAELQLQKTTERLALALKSGAIGCWEWDIQQNIAFWDDRMYELYGVCKEKDLRIVYEIWAGAIHPEDRAESEMTTQQIATGQVEEYDTEFRVVHPDGSIHFVKAYGTLNRDASGNPLSIIGINFDISDRKFAEESLAESEAFNRQLVEEFPIGLASCRMDGQLLFVNSAFAKILGRTIEETLELTYWDITPIKYAEQEAAQLERIQIEGRYGSYEKEYIHKDGHLVPVLLNGLAIAQKGELIIWSSVQDISDRKQAEQIILQQANRETLLRGITQRIRQSLDLHTIFDTACEEIRQLIQSDRVGIFKFYPESNFDNGEFVAESLVEGLSSVLEIKVHDHCFGEKYAPLYQQGRYAAMDDIYQLERCHTDVLALFQVRANLVMPLLCGNQLWGLLCIHQCSSSRHWQEHEINLIQQIANQLAIAIQQASLYVQLQEELLIREQAQLKIAQQLREQQTLATITNKIRESLSLRDILAVVTQQVKDVLSGDRALVFQLFDNGNSQIVEESVHSNFPNLKDFNWDNEVWSQEILDCYWQGKPRIVPDVMNDIWAKCLVEYSLKGQIKSKIIAPILLESHNSENHRWVATDGSKKLWGVLVIHACAEPREWQDSEAQLLQQIANQLAIAIQQASLYEQSQQEIAERKQAQQQLTETNEQLARATRLKDEFLANMSHELRTPLNSILGMNEGLQDEVFGSINEDQLKALQTIENSSTHLLALINDILDVAKIESGQVTLELTATDLDSLCKSSLAFIKQQALTKRIQLIHRIPKHLPEIMLDERRIRQVLINLLNNAVKFTLAGGTITLEVSQVQGESSTTNLTPLNYIKIAVIDTGIGISAENIQKLFQPFMQIDSALNRQYNGTGLGLALVKRLVEIHGGTVELTSELGVGSCFAINLPINIGDPAIEEQPDQNLSGQPQKGQSQTEELISPLILLAEDNEANIATFTSYLEARGYRILLATDGQQAIDLAKSHSPDLILMDIQMPVIDGLEAIKQIRLDPNLADIPIIALTALAMEGDREKCLEAGANEYLTKPIKLKILVETIQNILKNRN